MFHIAICDDSIESVGELERIIVEYEKKSLEKISIQKYVLGENLYADLEMGQRFDLIFLDIEFGQNQKSGLDIGNQIRQKLKDEYTHIVYISARDDCYEAAFESRPIHFLHKPFLAAKVVEDVEVAMLRSRMYGEEYPYQKGHTLKKVYVKDILYFEPRNHKMVMHMTNGIEEAYYEKMKDVVAKLQKFSFLSIHKSFFVCTDYVSQWRSDEVVMRNGDVLPISRARKKDVIQFLMEERVI